MTQKRSPRPMTSFLEDDFELPLRRGAKKEAPSKAKPSPAKTVPSPKKTASPKPAVIKPALQVEPAKDEPPASVDIPPYKAAPQAPPIEIEKPISESIPPKTEPIETPLEEFKKEAAPKIAAPQSVEPDTPRPPVKARPAPVNVRPVTSRPTKTKHLKPKASKASYTGFTLFLILAVRMVVIPLVALTLAFFIYSVIDNLIEQMQYQRFSPAVVTSLIVPSPSTLTIDLSKDSLFANQIIANHH